MRAIFAWVVALLDDLKIRISPKKSNSFTPKQVLLVVGGIVFGVIGIFVLWAAFIIFAFAIADNDCYYPSDQELIDRFDQNRADFQALLGMFLSDEGLERVDYDWTRPDNPQDVGVSPERITQYRQYFDKLGLPKGVIGFGKKDNISFPVASCGIAVSGTSQGYAYVQATPELLVDSIENYHHGKFESYTIYRHLSGNWYLYYDFED
jgi:hypothetical protein